MKIVVIGGSGLIGSRLVSKLTALGHEAVAASPRSGVNAVTGEGLAVALHGASVVVDVSNAPSWEAAAVLAFFQTSTANLLAEEAAQGVKHHVALSVVGTERLQESPYFPAKLAQEKQIQASPIPYTIVRATQFFEFVKSIGDAAVDGDRLRLPAGRIQPIAADDVAAALATIATGEPAQGIVELAGPESFLMADLIRQDRLAANDTREVITDPQARYFGAPLQDGTLVAGADALLGATHFSDWRRVN